MTALDDHTDYDNGRDVGSEEILEHFRYILLE